jgi:hypothetical protein
MIPQGTQLEVADHPDTNYEKARAALRSYVSQPASETQGTPARTNYDYKKKMQDQQTDMDYIYGKVGF